MRRLGIIAVVMVMVAAFVAMPVTVAKKTVNVPLAPTMQLANSTMTPITQQAGTVSITVPVIEISDANARECDPSGGLHPGLALQCFLQWLMEFTDPSDGF